MKLLRVHTSLVTERLIQVQVRGEENETLITGVLPRAVWTDVIRPILLLGSTAYGIHLTFTE